MTARRKRLHRFRRLRTFERRVLLAAFVLGGLGWAGSLFVYPTPDIPDCASKTATQEVVRSLSRSVPQAAARQITVRRSWEKDRADGELVLRPGDSRHCAAVAQVDGRRPQVIRYNIVPDQQPPGYRVAVFQHRLLE